MLLVDDNRVSRRVCAAQLQRLGVKNVSQGEGGRKAIALSHSQIFDLILMDIQMAEVDGWQAAQQIRLLLSTPNQPRIVGLTTNSMQAESDRCLGVGMNDTLSKPSTLAQLQTILLATRKIAA